MKSTLEPHYFRVVPFLTYFELLHYITNCAKPLNYFVTQLTLICLIVQEGSYRRKYSADSTVDWVTAPLILNFSKKAFKRATKAKIEETLEPVEEKTVFFQKDVLHHYLKLYCFLKLKLFGGYASILLGEIFVIVCTVSFFITIYYCGCSSSFCW